VEGEGSHNVIVPTTANLLIGTITNRPALGHSTSSSTKAPRIPAEEGHPGFYESLHSEGQIMTDNRSLVSCYFCDGP
jgi:hypothetical protein